MKELSLEKAVLLPSYHYHDNIEQYDPQEVIAAMKKECSKSQLSAHQLQRIVKSSWKIADRPVLTTSGQAHDGHLHCNTSKHKRQNHTSVGDARRLPDYQFRHINSFRQNSTMGFRRDICTTTTRMVQCPSDVVWRLKRAMYGLRTSPRLWQLHLRRVLQEQGKCRVLQGQGLVECKSDRRLFTASQLIVLVYVDDLLLIGCPTQIERVCATALQLEKTFTLKHTPTFSLTQDIRFLGNDYSFTKTTQSASHWSLPTTRLCCVPTTSTTTMSSLPLLLVCCNNHLKVETSSTRNNSASTGLLLDN